MSVRNGALLAVTLFIFFLTASATQLLARPSKNSTGEVRGLVLDGNGKPLSGATVYALPETDMKKQFHTASNDAGEFVLAGLPEGKFFLSAFKESDWYPYNFFSFFISPGDKTPIKVQVTASETTKDVRIQLGERAARLDIQITTEDGKPIEESATLVFTRPDQPGNYSRGASSSESVLVPPVPFHLVVQADGYKTWHYTGNRTGLIALKPSETFPLIVRLERLP